MTQCIAKYLRVSLEDFDLKRNIHKDESNSIFGQRKLIEAYIADDKSLCDLPVVEFVDDGFTGTNFDRPGFKQMLEQVKSGDISCVIVKDLSRFGRNYLEVGNYLEHLFPFLGVRFIAVNDMYDSADYSGYNMGVDLAFKNILHDYYSKDLSAKVRSAQRSRMMTGKYVNVPPYGYLRDPGDKHHLIPDPKTAPIVKDIFSLIIAGRTTAEVAKHLNAIKAVTPFEAKGSKCREGMASEKPHIWTHRAVLNILNNYKYTGAMVNHTRENQTLRAKSQKRVDESDWIINEGMHEALVCHEDYHKAHQALRTVKKSAHKEPDLLTGVYYCACCGRRLRKTHGITTYLSCETPYYQEEAPCANIRWKLPEIESLVMDSFKMHVTYLDTLKRKTHPQKENPAKQYISDMARLKLRLDQYQAEKVELYTDYKTGRISRDEFIQKKAEQTRETEEISRQLQGARDAYESFLAQKAALEEAEEKMNLLIPKQEASEEEILQLMYQGIDRVLVFDDGKIEVIWKYENIFDIFASAG